jgi:hypothetical protein
MRARVLLLTTVVVLAAALAWLATRPSLTVDESAQAGRASPRSSADAPADVGAPQPENSPPAQVEDAPLVSPPRREADPSAGLAAVLGSVTFEGGAPAPGVLVRMFAHSRGSAPIEQRTDAEGQFEFLVESGTWQLGGEAPAGFLSWRAEFELAPDAAPRADHVLVSATPLCVRVWNLVEGVVQPLEKARVAVALGVADGVEQRTWSSGAPLAWSVADEAGRCSVGAAPWRQQMLFVEADGFASAALLVDARQAEFVQLAQGDGCVHVFLDRVGPTLRGRVVGADGEPLAGALVSVFAPFVEERGYALQFGLLGARAGEIGNFIFAASSTRPAATTDAAGRFEVASPDPAAGPRTAFGLVVHPGRADYPHHHVHELDPFTFGQSLEVEIRVDPGREYELELVDEQGQIHEGVASVRDPDGRAYAPPGRRLEAYLENSHAGRFFPLVDGRLRLRHVGGLVTIGVTPTGEWSEDEVMLTLPPAGAEGPLRVVLPR